MLNTVAIHNARGDVLSLDLAGSSTNPIQIRDIDGLGPVKATINTTQFADFDGEGYSGSTVGNRNLTFIFGLNPNWSDQTYSSLRRLLYKFLMPKMEAEFHFFSDDVPHVAIKGYVESFDPNIFSSDPEAQVSIICPLPDFIAVDPTVVNWVAGTSKTIDYDGDVVSGLTLKMSAAAGLSTYSGNLVIRNITPEYGRTQDFLANGVVINGSNSLEVNTSRGKKYIQNIALPGGTRTSVLQKVPAATSKWIELMPGQNVISLSGAASGLALSLTYFERFGGL